MCPVANDVQLFGGNIDFATIKMTEYEQKSKSIKLFKQKYPLKTTQLIQKLGFLIVSRYIKKVFWIYTSFLLLMNTFLLIYDESILSKYNIFGMLPDIIANFFKTFVRVEENINC